MNHIHSVSSTPLDRKTTTDCGPLSYPQTDVFLVLLLRHFASILENVREKWIPEVRTPLPGRAVPNCRDAG